MRKVFKIIRGLLMVFGLLFIIMVVLALTPAPFYMHYALGNDPNENGDTTAFVPECVVMFGGAGMPSAGNLMRLYYTGSIASHHHIPVVIVHPEDSICQHEMGRLLIQEGLKEIDLSFMTKGTNTRSQVLELAKAYPRLTGCNLVVVTSPEHLRRTAKCLAKAGFTNVRGVAAREATVDFDLSLKKQDLKGNESIPSVESTNLRYTFWNYFQLEVICLREYTALAYYKVKGWI